MATYKVLEKSYINEKMVEVGEIIDYDGEASGNLELIKDVSRRSSRDNTTEADLVQ